METGIPGLDEFLVGGIPAGKSMVYFCHPGIEGEVFCMQTLYHNLSKDVTCVFIVSGSNPVLAKDKFTWFGWDIRKFEDKLTIVDAYSALVGAPSSERYLVADPESIDSMNEVINKVMEDVPKRSIIIISSLSNIMDTCGEEKTLEAVELWNEIASSNEHVIFYGFTSWPYPGSTISVIRDEIFNSVICIGSTAERVISGQYFEVLKADWTDYKKKSILFRVLKPGGIKIYIPKILVTGPFYAGKSTFVRSLSTRAISVDRLGTTIALDHGYIDYKGVNAYLFGRPGQERFDPLIKMISTEARGVFLVVDSTEPKDFAGANQMLEIIKGNRIPYVIIANKQDIPGAMPVNDIRTHFDIPEDTPIIPAIATEKKGVFEAFELLVEKITGAT